MKNIKIILYSNKTFSSENIDDVKILEDENNATLIDVKFPEEYEHHSKRVDFMNMRGEKWTTSLYAPEDENNEYDSNFDKLNFSFTIPSAMAKRGELQIQFIAYLADGSDTIVPFQVLIATINKSIIYATKMGRENPELIISAYEYSNQALALSREALEKTSNSERAALESEQSADRAETKAEEARISASKSEQCAIDSTTMAANAEQSALESANSASEAQESARQADERAARAEQVSNDANIKSGNAVSTSNSANEKSTSALDIVENLTVSSEEIDCEEKTKVEIQTNSATKRKNVHFSIPAPKKGTSYRNKGVWSSTNNYVNDQYFIDTVSLHGCTYCCKVSNTNQEPLPSEENQYWGLIAIKGSDAGVTIEDNLNSTNADHVLSAKQGKVLKELISASIETAINNLVNNAPEELNTLGELASALTNIVDNAPSDRNTLNKLSTVIDNTVDNAPDARNTLNKLSIAIDSIVNNESKIQSNNGSVQLGAGTNSNSNTLQFRSYQLLDSSGNVPMARLLNSVYPIGSLYLSVNGTNPGTLFGGTWTQLPGGYALVTSNNSSGGDDSTANASNHKLGNSYTGGLPNISGHIEFRGTLSDGNGLVRDTSGAFSNAETSSKQNTPGSNSTTRYTKNVNFNASSSNGRYGVYQNGATRIIPDHIAVVVWKRTA